MADEISIATNDLKPTFAHLECVDCPMEATLFRRVCEERDELATQFKYNSEQIAAFRAENARLREILCSCASAIGNGAFARSECSLKFLALIPEEIRMRIKSLTKTEGRAP